MFLKLFLAFTLIPALELYLLIEVGSRIGALNTISLILLTGMAGAWLAQSQGLRVIRSIQEKTAQGLAPSSELIQGIMVLVGGITLLTPGFITDIIGLSLIMPGTRHLYARAIENYIKRNIQRGTWTTSSNVIEINLNN